MFTAMKQRRDRLVHLIQNYVHEVDIRGLPDDAAKEKELVSLLRDWLEIRDEKSDRCSLLFDKMKPLFQELLPQDKVKEMTNPLVKIWSERDMFPKLSQWITGGDGWAYDIGFGGLDHVEAFEANDVNVLVVDTEMYSNTGGQASKSTPAGASVKFAVGGKQQKKKSLGEMFMTYEHVYVASVSLHNQAQTLQAFIEADRHSGPSIIIAYAPCIQQGVRNKGMQDMFEECKFAVDSGYWPLYRFNPELALKGQNPFTLDSKKLRKDVKNFLARESRFLSLKKKEPLVAEELWKKMNYDVNHRMEHLQQLAAGYKAVGESANSVLTLFASETGTANRVARDFSNACKLSGVSSALDDVEVDDLEGKTVVFFVATCGQGAMPQNGRKFLKDLQTRTEPFKEGTRFMVFGLGDSSYFFYLKAAKDIEARMEALGAEKMLTMGEGDDSAEDGLDGGLQDWLSKVWPSLELPPPSEVPHIIPVEAIFSEKALLRPEDDQRALQQFFHSDDIHATWAPIISNERLCKESYNRDFRTIRIGQERGLEYELGDALEIFPQNDPDSVTEFLHRYTTDYDEGTVIKLNAFGIKGEISLGALFTYVLDLFGKPSKHFLHELATFETDETERNTMLEPDFLKKAGKETGMTIADALLRFRKAQPPLPALLAMIPQIKPRAYSIASTPLASKGVVELLVLIETWWCDDGMRYGMTCNMLRQLKAGDHIWCRMHPGSMEPPEPSNPVVCVGIGSGLAPHIAFLRDHVRAAEEGEKVGHFSMYFGNRFHDEEFLLQEEMEGYAKKYDWCTVHSAFSRDDPSGKKVYVQDLVGQTDDARRLLREDPNGLLYICGNRNLPGPLQEALVKSFSKDSKDEKELKDARAAMEELYIRSRAQQEVW